MNKNILGALSLSIAASIWGGMYVVSKYVMDFIPPITLVWLRYLIAFFVLFAVLKISRRKNTTRSAVRSIEKKDWFLFAWIGFIGYFLSIILQFVGTKLSDAHTGALITSATPAFIIIFARFLLNEPFTFRKITALILATFGVIIVIGWEVKIGSYFWGSLILVGAALTWALLSIFVKIASVRHSSLTITTYAILFAFLFTTPFMVWEAKSQDIYFADWPIILGILYIGLISTAVAFFLWNKGFELMEAGIGSIFMFFQPVVGSVLGWLLLDERLDTNFFIGGLLIAIGVAIITLKKEKI